jgi:hypothetical protein
MIAAVFGPIAAAAAAGSISRVSGRTSTKRGVAPTAHTASADPTNVFAGTSTSCPRPIPSPASASSSSSVPLPTPAQCPTPQ